MNTADFLEILWQKGDELYRDMPWRRDTRPYYVLVSELMLQQTQVDRVIPKFTAFIDRFPDAATLAAAPLADVLIMWSGLGYNRRARFLHESAKRVMVELGGVFPRSKEELLSLSGVGAGTAGAIMAYAFNIPEPFIETNVRTVYFHHYFEGQEAVSDAEILEKVKATIDHEHPREFYWAIMDYGTWLKKQGVGQNDRSVHYKKQAPLKGSVREVRGRIIHELTKGELSLNELRQTVGMKDRFVAAFEGLLKDGLLVEHKGIVHLTK